MRVFFCKKTFYSCCDTTIDRVTERLGMAKSHGHAETINFEESDVMESLIRHGK